MPNRGKVFDKDVPGPAKYNLLTTQGFGMEAPKYTINPEKKYVKNDKDYVEPGPGQYESTDNFEGIYPVSSLRSTVKNLWGSSKVERFKNPSK